MSHSFHFDPDWVIHVNGDPIPGPFRINRVPPPGEVWDQAGEHRTFHTTAEEVFTFVLGVRTEAIVVSVPVKLTTAAFMLLPNGNVALAALDLDLIQKQYFERDPESAKGLTVPFSVLEAFVMQTIHSRFESYLGQQDRDLKTIAAMGAFVLLTAKS